MRDDGAGQIDDTATRTLIVSAGPEARLLVDAQPGAGKTHLAAARIGSLIKHHISPGQILVLSFSRSAVRTLTRRLATASDDRTVEELRYVSIRTFDSWAFRVLRAAGAPVDTLLAAGYDENIAALTRLMTGPKRGTALSLIGDRRHIIIDEFQDLPGVRGELVLALLGLIAPTGAKGAGYTVLGDPAQAIYGFAAGAGDGGKPWPTPRQYWARVSDAYGDDLKRLTLTRNYRATAPIAAISNDMRAILTSALSEGAKYEAIRTKVEALPAATAALDPARLATSTGSKAILTRTNGEALAVLAKLVGRDNAGWPTRLRLRAANHAHLPPAWIGALLRKLRSSQLTRSQFNDVYAHLTKIWDAGQQRALELPDRETAWVRLARAAGGSDGALSIALADLRERLFWPDAFPDDQQVADDGLIVATIHQSKGMEFDVVTLLGARRDQVEDNAEDDGEGADENTELVRSDTEIARALEEEANVAYVAVTRAAQTIERLAPDSIWRPPAARQFQHGRERYYNVNWRKNFVNLELGMRGDIDPASFADPALHGGEEGVEELQSFLLTNARSLEGHKVMLTMAVLKRNGRPDVFYDISLQHEKTAGRLLGRTTRQVTYDLLHLLHPKYHLPGRIMNLRISGVGTVTANDDSELAEPEKTSRLWLGVALFGTGDFIRKKKG